MKKQKRSLHTWNALMASGLVLLVSQAGCGGGGTSATQSSRPAGYLVATKTVAGKSQLFRIDLKTGVATQVTSFASSGAHAPTTAGFNEPIFFLITTPPGGGSHGLAKVNPDGTGYTYLGPLVELPNVMRISQDGQKIAYLSLSGKVVTVDPDGTNEDVVFSNQVVQEGASISPDGSKVYFTSIADGEPDAWVVNSDGTNATNLTPDLLNGQAFRISPDGLKIAFAHENLQTSDVHTMTATGNNLALVGTMLGDVKTETWTDDGQWIVLTHWSQSVGKIVLLKADGSGQVITLTAEGNISGVGDAVTAP